MITSIIFSRSRSRHMFLAFMAMVAILGFMSSPGSSATVKLSWGHKDVSRVAGHNIYFGLSGSDYKAQPKLIIDNPRQMSCQISGLTEGSKYVFAATSFDHKGNESPFSASITHTFPVSSTGGEGASQDDSLNWSSHVAGQINLLKVDQDSVQGSKATARRGDSANMNDDNLQLIFGQVPVNHRWSTVELPPGFSEPVVVAGPLSLNDDHPCVVRIRNVTSSSFEIRLQEYEYLDGVHSVETVSYLAMERGYFQLADGTLVEAGRLDSSASSSDFDTVPFGNGFTQAPVVMASLNSFNDHTAVATRVLNTSAAGFEFQMQEQEGSNQSHGSEAIGYIAWQCGSGNSNNVMYEADTTADQVTHEPFTVQFSSNFSSVPVFLAHQQTRNGGDTANLRLAGKSRSKVRILVDEEQARDKEVTHIAEQIGYLCLMPIDF